MDLPTTSDRPATSPPEPTADQPLVLGRGPRWRRPIALAPMTNQQSNPDGSLGEDELTWLRSRAGGGFGAVLTCASHVSRGGQAFPGQLGVFDDSLLPGLHRVAQTLTAHGSAALVQLHHGGRRSRADLTGQQPLAPWDDPARGARAARTGEVDQVVADFVAAAVRAQTAGFDGVELHGAHGYLISQFLSQRNIERADRYGGSLPNRFRFLREIPQGIRDSTGPQFQVGVRLGSEGGGTDVAEARWVVEETMASGLVDFVDLSMGDVFKEPEAPQLAGRPLLEHFTDLPRHGVRLGAAGSLRSTDDVLRALGAGLDFVLVGLPGIVHGDFPARVVQDAAFRASTTGVSREQLRRSGVSDTFLDYLGEGWPTLLAPE